MDAEARREPELDPGQEKIEESYRQMQKDINFMAEGSEYERVVEADKEIITSPEGEKFTIRKITDPEDPSIEKIYKLLEKRFDEEEIDTVETIRDAIATKWGAYHVIEDVEGNILTHTCVGLLNLENPDNRPEEREGILFVGYILNDPAFHKPDLGREIMHSVYKDTLQEAKSKNMGVKGIVGESVERVEPLANMAGLKRVYFEDGDGNVNELPFECPPINWDKDTGEPLEAPTPEHLIIKLMDDRQSLSIDEVLSMVWTIYKQNYIFPETVINSPQARERNHKVVFEDYYNKLKSSLSKAGSSQLFMMSLRERRKKAKELKTQGKELIEVEIPKE